MSLIPLPIAVVLMANWRAGETETGESPVDCVPYLKLFTTWSGATWIISEQVAHDPDLLFGVCDLGVGEPELGYVRLSELVGASSVGIERDLYFRPRATISVYASAARLNRSITEDPAKLKAGLDAEVIRAKEAGRKVRGRMLSERELSIASKIAWHRSGTQH